MPLNSGLSRSDTPFLTGSKSGLSSDLETKSLKEARNLVIDCVSSNSTVFRTSLAIQWLGLHTSTFEGKDGFDSRLENCDLACNTVWPKKKKSIFFIKFPQT